MDNIRKSRYCFLINKDDTYLVYLSSTNSFYKINSYVADLIDKTNIDVADIDKEDNSDEIKSLRKLKILTTETEDNNLADLLRIKFLMHSYSKESLGLVIAPTLACNLRCPYCFEKHKRHGLMDAKTCDSVIDFINSHTFAKTFSLTWYGGEPLLGADAIRRILSKIGEVKDIKLTSHGMVTNATLLTGKNIELFREHPLDSLQVTLDGAQPTHDTKRIYADGRGSYTDIMRNLKEYTAAYPDTNISIRVNIDKDNADQFMTVYDTIKDMFPDKRNISVYPGIITGCGKKEQGSPLLMNADVVAVKAKFRKCGYPQEYPHTSEWGCMATCLTGYLIGPEGEIYKCWEDVGDETMVVGNIFDKKYTNMPLLAKYMLHGSHILEEECQMCPFLPICSNDCAHNRVSNKFNGTEYELCSIYKGNDFSALSALLHDYYLKFVESQPVQQQ